MIFFFFFVTWLHGSCVRTLQGQHVALSGGCMRLLRGLAHCALWESERSLSVQPSAQDTWDSPLQNGDTNRGRPAHYTRLPSHTHLPRILHCACLVFKELAQIEALRSLLIFSKPGLFLFCPKIHRRVVCIKLTGPLQVCGLATRKG